MTIKVLVSLGLLALAAVGAVDKRAPEPPHTVAAPDAAPAAQDKR